MKRKWKKRMGRKGTGEERGRMEARKGRDRKRKGRGRKGKEGKRGKMR